MKRRTRVLLVALLILGVGVPSARAVTLSGRASTQALWFSDEFDQDHLDLAQYVRFNSRQFDKGDTVQVAGYGRGTWDSEEGGVDGRLYYLFVDKRELVKRTDVRLGRQFFFVSAGSGIVDGARLDTRIVGPLALTVVGGRHVFFGFDGGEATRGGDVAGAAQLSVTSIPQGYLDLSYFVKYDENDLARENLGLAASKRFSRYGELYTQLRFDLLSEVFSEIQAGARTAIVPKLTLKAEYFRSIPQFDATSIFVVFAAEEFQEVLLRADYQLTPRVSLDGEYRHESFSGGETANVGEAGVRYRPTDATSVYGAGIWRVGTGGNLYGFEISGDMMFRKNYVLAAGVQHDNFRRELGESYDSATRVWGGAEAKLRKNVSASGRYEYTHSQQFDRDVRARLALNIDF